MNSIPPMSGSTPSGAPRGSFAELNDLLEALCEDRITSEETQRLEQLVLADHAALRYYLDYIALHGTLLWDTAKGGDETQEVKSSRPAAAQPVSPRPFNRRAAAVVAAALLVIVSVVGFLIGRPDSNTVAQPDRPAHPETASSGTTPDGAPDSVDSPGRTQDDGPAIAERTMPDNGSNHSTVPDKTTPDRVTPRPDNTGVTPPEKIAVKPSTIKPSKEVSGPLTVAFVNEQIRAGWESSSIRPSPRAEETEWLRRVNLDIVGRIPTPEAVERFLKDKAPNKREQVVDQLLDDPLYVRHWTTVWTNLLIGRSSSRDEIRFGLEKFLRESFAYNRPWSEVVTSLVSAEGTPEENGASGFLLAHLNNEAVPATAITSRVFLGVQIQCSQCHPHPLNDRTQNEFWEFNSFFQQTARIDRSLTNPKTGKPERHPALVSQPQGGLIYYETKSGLMRAALPRFGGETIDPAPTVNRRAELARLMIDSSQNQVARAMVNRTWEHFFGASFTRGVDDMGPHNPPTHPAVLERLTDDFVKSGYDLKQLIRWICATDAYQRSSRFNEASASRSGDSGNVDDDPAIGNQPLFSRVYVKSMTAEQLYDSMLVATRADDTPRASRVDLDRQRHDWIQQFVVSFDNEENNEAITFDGTIPQALMMMNSDLVATAVSREPGTYLSRVVRNSEPEPEKIRQLCLAALSRQPTPKEMTVFRKLLRERTAKAPRATNRDVVLAEGLQDVFWAFLNSNEFVLVH